MNMEERNDVADQCDKIDEVMLPGFRFHPTDEELVGFYLRRKVQHKPLSIELIKQLDIYKYDPWDLPKLATTGEKEWYFYCPRDRKYRNSARPNRVTGAGFWKATGTDRPIYSSEGSKCIGLKKSLVFYKGRAAKGIKTDWMMHEFRLPSVSDSVPPNKRYLDKNIPANEAWAICRIFKKANSSAQRAISHSWVSPAYHAYTTTSHDTANPNNGGDNNNNKNNIQFSSSNITYNTSKTSPPSHLGFYNDHVVIEQQSSLASFSPAHFLSVENKPFLLPNSNEEDDHLLITPSYTTLTSNETSLKCATNDASSLLLDMSASVLGDLAKGSENLDYSMLQDQCSGMSALLPEDLQENLVHGEVGVLAKGDNVGQILDEQWGGIKSFPYGYPLSLPNYEALKSNLVFWDSFPCPTELSTTYSTNKGYT